MTVFKMGKLVRVANKARLATYLIALWKLFKHPQTPRAAKITSIAVLAYVLSPIDLIPDFIPVLGLLDELVIVPLGIALVVRLTPKPLWESLLREAEASRDKLPKLWWGAAIIVLVWLLLMGLLVWWLVSLFGA
ncbi:YkvA family protein [Piscinibacter sp. HJYY11]|uniref:YkvA family protein n=1 Tax=Piscinibacter sp. HJYY11 TaxID=2801333 RepID=UPI0028732F95|nr:YkvA family protein [Piscinibacter sp. HJYY11]